MSATNRNIKYPKFEAKNHSRSVDAHFQDAAGSMSLLLFVRNGYQYLINRYLQPIGTSITQDAKLKIVHSP